MAMTSLEWPDYVILAVFLVISLGIGFYHSVTGGRQRTTQEFIMGNRKLGILPTAISMFVSFQSAIMILGLTAEMYQYGVQYLVWTPVSFTLAILLTERLMIPWIYPLKLVSVNDYLEQRFESKAVRVLGSILSIIGEIMYIGVAMYAPSAALETATGLPTTVSIPLMAVVSITYTALGGMRAVIWTDVFQFCTMIGGILTILIKGVIVVGGYQTVLEVCSREGRLQTTNWNPNPTERHTVWGFLIGWTISWTQVYSLTQASVQRYSATESLIKARLVLLLNIPAIVLLTFVVCSTGLTVFAYYSLAGCDPIVNKDVSSPNQLLPLFVATLFNNIRGFNGLFLATLYGGALSSVSSSLSGSAANCWDDILKIKLAGMLEHRKALLNRFLVVVFGSIATTVAFLASIVPGPISQISMSFGSAVFGPILGVFLIGGISRHANWRGALAGGITALCFNCWVIVGSYQNHGLRSSSKLPPVSIDGCLPYNTSMNGTSASWYSDSSTTAVYEDDVISSRNQITVVSNIAYFYAMSYVWYTLVGTTVASIVGSTMSLVFRDRGAEARVDSRLLIPFRHFFSWSIATTASPVAADVTDAMKTDKYEITDKGEDALPVLKTATAVTVPQSKMVTSV